VRVSLFHAVCLLVCLGLAGGCSSSSQAPSNAAAIARVGDHTVSRDDFGAWLAEVLGGQADVAGADPEVRSRLLDQFLDEELLLAEARRRRITVSEEEASAQLPGEGADPARVRRALLLKRFNEEVILKGVAVSDEEVAREFEMHREDYHRPATAVLRKVLLDSPEEARQVRQELQERPAEFERIAETRSLAPDGGQAQPTEEAMLPDTLRHAVASLQPGELSPVVEDPQGFFIVKLEARQPERAPVLEEVHDAIKLRLLQEKSQQRFLETVSALRGRIRIEILRDKLDFPYQKKKGNA
jgi:parvulin-like peptidyl-prolyl isomerase